MSESDLDKLVAGCQQVYSAKELGARLAAAAKDKRQLRVKLGMDPTAPDIHLGHSVVLNKMRQFQDLGHKAVLIIGDFTARIGDPTGRSKTRPVLKEADIDRNAETYFQQAGKILDTSEDKLEIRRNSEWLNQMDFADVLRLVSRMTVGQLLHRDDFRQRYESETPIGLHEMLYPLVQGWDSVNIKSDVELGATDQTYNNLVGRDLQTSVGQPPQIVMIMPILRGTDGVKKMSKSLGNYIGVSDAATDVFGKTMSIPDELIGEWFSLLTNVPEAEWQATLAEHPMKAKERLAKTVGSRFHGADAMAEAATYWHDRFGKKKSVEAVDVAIPAAEIEDGKIPAWKLAWHAHDCEISKSEARRMVQNGAFEFDGAKITDMNAALDVAEDSTFRAGRHRSGPQVKQPLIARVKIS